MALHVTGSDLDGRMTDSVRHAATIDALLIGVLAVVDLIAVSVATLVASYGRSHLSLFARDATDLGDLLSPVVGVIVLAWLLGLTAAGSYRLKRIGAGTSEYSAVLVASALTAGALGSLGYLTQYPLSRGFFVLLFSVGIPALLIGRASLRRLLHVMRRNGMMTIPVLVAGAPDHVDDVAAVLTRESWLGYKVVGALLREPAPERTPAGIQVVGSPDDTLAALRTCSANTAIFAEGSFLRATDFNAMARQLEEQQARMIVVPALTDIAADRLHVRPVAGLPLVHVEQPSAFQARRWKKRAFDLVGSALLIIILSPLMLVIGLAIRLTDPGSVLFRQIRVGTQGKPFACLKFRSMHPDAEQRLAQLQEMNESDGTLFKIREDPRITPVGRFIRRFSLDELPQLFNVLQGQMSLVGPRPALPNEVSQYEDHVHRRLDVRPGMTGLWQVSGRSDLAWEDAVRLDLYYVDNWSMVRDLGILLRTFSAVLVGRGAY